MDTVDGDARTSTWSPDRTLAQNTVSAILQADAAGQGGRTHAVPARPRFLAAIGMDIATFLGLVIAGTVLLARRRPEKRRPPRVVSQV